MCTLGFLLGLPQTTQVSRSATWPSCQPVILPPILPECTSSAPSPSPLLLSSLGSRKVVVVTEGFVAAVTVLGGDFVAVAVVSLES